MKKILKTNLDSVNNNDITIDNNDLLEAVEAVEAIKAIKEVNEDENNHKLILCTTYTADKIITKYTDGSFNIKLK